jgi:hypothetical protein
MKKALIHINDQLIELTEADQLPFSIKYSLEDIEDFEKKKGAESFNIEIPASLLNAAVANSFHNVSIQDLTVGKVFRSVGSCCVEINGYELLVGKAFLKSAKHKRNPTTYNFDLFGDNADWVVDLKETTLFDLVQHINFQFTKAHIISTWTFDGTSENVPYVFAPVRYREAMADGDTNMIPSYMRPSLSPYWIIYWGFKSIGYKINTEFLDTSYFRRKVMPWTWGNFLYSEGTRQDNVAFLAKSSEKYVEYDDFTGYADLLVTNDSTEGAFDNNDSYAWDATNKEMEWTYLPAFNYGNLDVTLSIKLDVDSYRTGNSHVFIYLRWFKNGTQIQEDMIWESDGDLFSGRREFTAIVEKFCTANVDANDVVSAKVYVDKNETTISSAAVSMEVLEFKFEYFRIPIGGTIDFKSFAAFKKYKFLDFLRGITDDFNLAFSTNTITKEVIIEPLHPYSLNNNLAIKTGGFIKENYVDWSDKQDLSKESEVILFSDGEREMIFAMKDDSNDGGMKVIQDRYSVQLARGKYLLPSRFKSGKNEKENRFFAPVMHYNVDQWKDITGVAPQMIAMIPENISNTSKQEAESTFIPRLAHYKGFDYTSGWRFDGDELDSFPFMFAVNYKPGGQNDPIISYGDEKIGNPTDGFVIGKGLLKRFFWQRMAIMRNGQYYKTYFRLNQIDATSQHREFKVLNGNKFELVSLEYRPLEDDSSDVFMRKWEPINTDDQNNTYPSATMLMDGSNSTDGDDIKYNPLILLTSDIPT